MNITLCPKQACITQSLNSPWNPLIVGVTLALTALLAIPTQAAEPFATTGHGAFFNSSGEQIALTLAHAEYAERWYREAMLKQLDANTQHEYKALEREVFAGLNVQRQDALLLRQAVLEATLAKAKTPVAADTTLVKLRALQGALRFTLPLEEFDPAQFEWQHHKIADAVRARLERLTPKNFEVEVLQATLNKGQAYLDECADAGVPIPPPINQMDPTGLTGWRSEGFIPQGEQFIVGSPAELRSYRSMMPRGMCYSLPRYNNAQTSITLDGVICLAEQSARACFWDNQWTPPGSTTVTAFNIAPGEIVPIGVPDMPGGKYQAGGAEIESGPGGVCTDCHAGENPYVVHPESLLRTTVAWQDIHEPSGDLPAFAVNRYVPLVGPSWPQNEASLTAAALGAATSSCNACHRKGGAGRIAHLSNQLPGYCNTVLRQAGQRTMPFGSPGSEEANVYALIAAHCNAPPSASVADVGDPHITTVNGMRYDFQAAGEFTLLTSGDDTFELQARQTPVLTTFTPGTNPHTGLASCPSLNTAVAVRVGKHSVSYQPANGALSSKEDLALFVDGVPVSAGNMNLGSGATLSYAGPGGAVQLTLADGSAVRVEPHYWSSQGYWYLDVFVDDTFARAGIMGLITAGDWLPRAPDGSSFGAKPASLNDRHQVLNDKFANSWRVSDKTSLFHYAPGTSSRDFTDPTWPTPPGGSCEKTQLPGDVPVVKEPSWELAREVCSRIKDKAIHADCMIDVAVLGEAEAAEVHWQAANAN